MSDLTTITMSKTFETNALKGKSLAAGMKRRIAELGIYEFTSYSSSGCWPSWAFQAHSIIFISVNTAVKEDSSGEQA